MAKKRFTHWGKALKNDPFTSEEITHEEAKRLVSFHVGEGEIKKRMDAADFENPIKCGIWLVWGWRYR